MKETLNLNGYFAISEAEYNEYQELKKKSICNGDFVITGMTNRLVLNNNFGNKHVSGEFVISMTSNGDVSNVLEGDRVDFFKLINHLNRKTFKPGFLLEFANSI